MPITAITGAASGIGAALASQLREAGHQVIGIDRANSDINVDLSTAAGRQQAIDAVLQQCGGQLDQLVLCAGVGVTAPSCGLILAVNYFAVSALLGGLADALSKGEQPSAVVVGSVASVQPGADQQPIVELMLAGDEAARTCVGQHVDLLAPAVLVTALQCFQRVMQQCGEPGDHSPRRRGDHG